MCLAGFWCLALFFLLDVIPFPKQYSICLNRNWFVFILSVLMCVWYWKVSAYSSDAEGCLALNYPLGKCIAVRTRPVSVVIDEWIGFWR